MSVSVNIHLESGDPISLGNHGGTFWLDLANATVYVRTPEQCDAIIAAVQELRQLKFGRGYRVLKLASGERRLSSFTDVQNLADELGVDVETVESSIATAGSLTGETLAVYDPTHPGNAYAE